MHAAKYTLHPDTPELVLSSIFKKYDEDNSGELDFEEFSQALDNLGIIDEHAQRALFHLADADNGGTISIDEFIELVKGHEFDEILGNNDKLEFVYQTYRTFQEYDDDGSGDSFVLYKST